MDKLINDIHENWCSVNIDETTVVVYAKAFIIFYLSSLQTLPLSHRPKWKRWSIRLPTGTRVSSQGDRRIWPSIWRKATNDVRPELHRCQLCRKLSSQQFSCVYRQISSRSSDVNVAWYKTVRGWAELDGVPLGHLWTGNRNAG